MAVHRLHTLSGTGTWHAGLYPARAGIDQGRLCTPVTNIPAYLTVQYHFGGVGHRRLGLWTIGLDEDDLASYYQRQKQSLP
jgi:hypothetical protein